ncbi:MAG: LytTR family DNA-binding domain-containing protein [Saprospiraceae bacterium]
MIRTLIVDDEPLALDILESYIEKMPDLHLVGRCENAFEANQFLKKETIDLMFLDIQMPQLTGVEFLKSLTQPPLTVFTTAFPNYAVEGFELNAVDYLLKPISLDRFMKAVNKVMDKMPNRSNNFHATEHEGEPHEGEDFIFVKADKKFVKVKYDDILYIEGLKDYVIIRNEKGRVITLQTMKSLEDKLPSKTFKRIHRSYIVNLNKVNAILGNMVEVIENTQPKHLPVGKNYKDELMLMIEKNRL